MVSDSTPLERLDSAIHEFLRETEQLDDGRFVTGWVIGTSTARLQADDDDALPLVTGATYALGPQTSTVQLAGLAQFLAIVAEKATWQQLSDDD
jgi:hypothetical protein